MGLFGNKKNKNEMTYIELLEFRKKNITDLKMKDRINEILYALKNGIIDKKQLDEDSINCILDFYIFSNKDFESISQYSNYVLQIINIILPYGEKTENYDKLMKLFVSLFEKDGLLDKGIFRVELYNLFHDKTNFMLLNKQILYYEETIANIDNIVNYACNNRQYFVSEEMFYNHMIKILKNVREWSIAGENINENLEIVSSENKRMNGIYDISEASLEELDDLINSANGLLSRLKDQCQISDSKLEELKEELESIKEKIQVFAKNEENNLTSKKEKIVEEFKKELAKIIIEQERKFEEKTDAVITDIGNEVNSKIGDLRLALQSASKVADNEIDRIRNAGNLSVNQVDEMVRNLNNAMESASNVTEGELQRIKKAGEITSKNIQKVLSENPELQKILEEYMPLPELLTKLNEVEKIINVEKPATIINYSPSIFIPNEIPQDINHFFDNRIPFNSRLEEIKELIGKREDEGEIFHEKFLTLIKMIIEDCNPYLWGNSGLGKTYMIEQAFNLLGLEYRPINKILEDYDIIGAVLPNGDFSKPLWYQCYKCGYGAFLDELDSSNSEATIVINSFTSNRKGSFYSFPNQEVVYRHPNFRIVAAGNTAGSGADNYFNDRKQLDESVQQRLMPLYLTPDSRIEKKILGDYPDWFEFVQNFRKATDKYAQSRDTISAPGEITTRDAQKIRQIKDNNSFTDEEIIEYEFIENKDDDYLGVLDSYLDRIYSESSSQKSRKLYKHFNKRVKEKRGSSE